MNRLLLLVFLALPCGAGEAPETLVSLDAREADLRGIVRAMADLGGVQAIFDAGVDCRLTLNVRQMPLPKVLGLALGACGLASEQEGSVLRIATPQRLTEEARGRRELSEAKERNRPTSTTLVRLSYARATELAPLVEKQLSPRGRVVVDSRTN